MRVTWVQPEDLVGHELRQAREEGKDVDAIEARWLAAGGAPAPARGASPGAGRARAAGARARAARRAGRAAASARRRRAGGLRRDPRRGRPGAGVAPTTLADRIARRLARPRGRLRARQAGREDPARGHPRDRARRPATGPCAAGSPPRGCRPEVARALAVEPREPPDEPRREHRRHARGRRPQLHAARRLRCSSARHRLRRARRRQALARLPAAGPDLHRRARRLAQPARGVPPARDRDAPQPVPRVDRRPAARRRVRLGRPRRPGRRRADGVGGRAAQPHRERRLRRDVHGRGARRLGRRASSAAACADAGLSVVPAASRLGRGARDGTRPCGRARLGGGRRRALRRGTATSTGCTRSTTRRSSRPRSTPSTATSRARSAAVVQGGWDTDTNGAAVGSILGATVGTAGSRSAGRRRSTAASRARCRASTGSASTSSCGGRSPSSRRPPTHDDRPRGAARPARPAADRPADAVPLDPDAAARGARRREDLAAPDDPADWPAWREALRRAGGTRPRARVAYDAAAYAAPETAWTQTCFSVALAWLWDELLYDHEAGRFTPERFVAESERPSSAASTASCSGTRIP